LGGFIVTALANNIGDLLTRRAALNPDREAVYDVARGVRLSFSELAGRAHALAADGVKPGDRVALLLMNSAEFIESFFAIARLGAVIVPLNWRLTPEELRFILQDSGARTLIFDEDFEDSVTALMAFDDRTGLERLLAVGAPSSLAGAKPYTAFRDQGASTPPPLGAQDQDPLYIMYTSGTTGLPKGVVHTHESALWGVLTISATADLRPGDRYLQALPLFHVGALTPGTACIYLGVTSIVMRSFDPAQAWRLIEEERVTTGLLVPAMLNFMLQVPAFEAFDRSALRWIMSGAAPVPVSLIERYGALAIDILQVYGLTETCGPACLIDSENALARVGSTGRAFFHSDVKIVAEDGTTCATGAPGEVWVRGRHIMREYWNRPEATAETLVKGWLRTGDVATMDAEGFVYIQDRIKDMIISGGENIYPAEVENVLLGVPGVVDAAVIGMTSERWGESPLAILVRDDPTLGEAAVLAHCQSRLARYKQPRAVRFVDSIPRNPSGKILKRVLREQFPEPAPE
jgi:acyl-CoA synthetase (AMP-forming)/AMP-acid ligase II